MPLGRNGYYETTCDCCERPFTLDELHVFTRHRLMCAFICGDCKHIPMKYLKHVIHAQYVGSDSALSIAGAKGRVNRTCQLKETA